MTVVRGAPEGAGRRVGVVVARFHEHVTAKLLEGALGGSVPAASPTTRSTSPGFPVPSRSRSWSGGWPPPATTTR